jgi:hypothetical protein
MLACTVGAPGLETPTAFEGDGVHAIVTRSGGCGRPSVRVGLWGENFGTRGEVHADVVPEDDGSTWLHFSVFTGLGEAVAALRIEGEAGTLPLGTRPGEHELHLKKTPIDPDKLKAAAVASAHGLNQAIKQWDQGAFLLQQDGETVGELRFRGDRPPMVSVFDAWWLTPRPVEAAVSAQGAEILLAFDVEPSLKGEGGLLRVNIPLGTAVAPIGDVPIDAERHFELVSGALPDGEFEAGIAAARQEADGLEVEAVEHNARLVAMDAVNPSGGCEPWTSLKDTWGIMFEGYQITVSETEEGCALGVAASRPQHGRRFRGVVSP